MEWYIIISKIGVLFFTDGEGSFNVEDKINDTLLLCLYGVDFCIMKFNNYRVTALPSINEDFEIDIAALMADNSFFY